MNKLYLNRILKIVVFLTILSVILFLIGIKLSLKSERYLFSVRTKTASQIFNELDNSIDVVYLGHSGVYTAYSPMEAYKSYGFTSYAVSQPIQKPWETLNYLQEIIKYQKLKVIVFDVYHLFYDSLYWLANGVISKTADKIFPIFFNRMMWKNKLGKQDDNLYKRNFSKGYVMSKYVNGYLGSNYLVETNEVYKIKKQQLKYLNKVYDLALNNNIELVLTEIPSTIRWNYSKYNAVNNYAKSKDIKFIYFNQELSEFDFDWTTDTRDKGDHLNHSGAVKFTTYFAKYLKNEFNLMDQRNNEQFNYWNLDLLDYEEMVRTLS